MCSKYIAQADIVSVPQQDVPGSYILLQPTESLRQSALGRKRLLKMASGQQPTALF